MTPQLSTFGATSAVQEQAPAPVEQPQEQPIVQAVDVIKETLTQPVQEVAPTVEQPQLPEDNSSIAFSLGEVIESPVQDNPEQPLPQYNWKDELKKIDRKELVAELGLDPFALELDQHIKGGGQPIDYLQARAIDYNKFSNDALVKDAMRKENPTLTPSQIDLLYSRKYSLSEDATEEDKQFITALLEQEAYKIRQSKIAEQQKFKIADTPIPQKDEAYEQWKQNRDTQAQNAEALRNYLQSHPATKALNESKRVTLNFGEGVAPFNFTIDKPELIHRVITDDGTAWNKLVSTSQGEPDVAKQQLLTLVAVNPQKFVQDIFNYGMQMGERKRVAEGQNAQRQQAIVTKIDSTDKGAYRTGTYGSK